MKTKFILSLYIISASYLVAQDREIVAQIDGEPILKSELQAAFAERPIEGERVSDFIRAYINMKLSVKEAKNQQLDTTANYKRNYASFKLQLAREYNKEEITSEPILEKIYKRTTIDLEVNHYLLPYPNADAILFPADTLSLYKKILIIRDNLIATSFGGENCVDHTLGGDIVLDKSDKNGYLGWIIPFTLPLTVEDMAYSIPVGQISMPIRSNKGYHIIQIINKRPAVGNINIEQVVYYFPSVPASQQQTDSMRQVVEVAHKTLRNNPASFAQLCNMYNTQMEITASDCDFGTYGLNAQLPASFITAAFELNKTGDVSPPVLTNYGYHFIRLKNKLPHPAYDDVKRSLNNRVTNGDRSSYYTKLWRDNYFKKFNLAVNNEVYDKIVDKIHKSSPLDTLLINELLTNRDELFTINKDVSIQVRDFAANLDYQSYIQSNPHMATMVKVVEDAKLSTELLQDLFEDYATRAITAYADSTLEERIPEFGKLMQTYASGILLYDIKKQNIWDKAKKDEEGLKNYYTKHKKKYTWKTPKHKGIILFCKNDTIYREVEQLAKKIKDVDKLIISIDKDINRDNKTVVYQTGVWDEGENKYIDSYLSGTKNTSYLKGYPYHVVKVRQITAPEEYRDVRAEVETDYQKKLENDWTTMLQKKYKVEINNSILKTIK